MKVRLSRVKHGEKVSLTDWNLSSIDAVVEFFQSAIMKAAAEALDIALSDSGDGMKVYATFPATWGDEHDGFGGKSPQNPLTVYVCFPSLSPNMDCGPILSFGIDELFPEFEENEAMAPESRRISAALRALADKIDAHIVDDPAG